MSTPKFVRATWSLSFSAWIVWILFTLRQSLLYSISWTAECGICNWTLAAQIDLHRLHWNASLMRLTFSSEVHVFPGDFTCNRLRVFLSLLFENGMLFPCRRLTSILCSKMTLDSCKRLKLCQPQHTLNFFLWCQHCYWDSLMSPAGACM
jgi:hypothetical protein